MAEEIKSERLVDPNTGQISINLGNSYERWTGSGTTNAPTPAKNTRGFDGAGDGYEFTPAGGWVAIPGFTFDGFIRGFPTTTADGSSAGLVVTVSKPTSYIKYTDATYEYYCQAAVASARSDAVWQVIRKTIATGDMLYAGTGLAAHAATDIATVAALTYTLGA